VHTIPTVPLNLVNFLYLQDYVTVLNNCMFLNALPMYNCLLKGRAVISEVCDYIFGQVYIIEISVDIQI
jgi:hypothetical protein